MIGRSEYCGEQDGHNFCLTQPAKLHRMGSTSIALQILAVRLVDLARPPVDQG